MSSLRLASWNVNGIRAAARTGGLAAALEAIAPDILCLQEVRARPDQVPPLPSSYLAFWHPADASGYAGTAILARRQPLATIHGLPPIIEAAFNLHADPCGNANREGRVIAAEFPTCWAVSVYMPYTRRRDLSRLSARCQRWEPAFLTFIRGLEASRFGTTQPKPVIVAGDFNVAHTELDLARPTQNHRTHGFTDEERACFQSILDAGFVDSFRYLHPDLPGAYTWWSNGPGIRERNIGWRIDYILTSTTLQNRLLAATIHADLAGSDHVPVSLDIDLTIT